jgi:hypothetical protein
MKIGFSLGRCVRDIVDGKVAIDDVAFIITATCIREKEQLGPVIDDYLFRDEYLYGRDGVLSHKIAEELWDSNKLIQPRREGIHRHKQPANSVWVDMFPTVPSENDAVKTAWENYRFMLHMVENVDTTALETFK